MRGLKLGDWLLFGKREMVTLELLEDSRSPEFMLGVVFVYLCFVGWH
jgi:hypothetical protein